MSVASRALRGLVARLRDALFRRQADRRADEEFRFHVEMETEKYIREGLDPAEARRRALVSFGGAERFREQTREGRKVPIVEDVWRDLRHAARGLRRSPGFTLAVVLSLALGVGANTSMFAMMGDVLLRPLPYPHAGRLVSIWYRSAEVGDIQDVEGKDVRAWQLRSRTLESVGLYGPVGARAIRRAGEWSEAVTVYASTNFLHVLGARTELGRWFSPGEDHVVVLSHALWHREFGGDPRVLGKTLDVFGHPRTVIGVLPAHVRVPVDAGLWIPEPYQIPPSNQTVGRIVARARAGVTIAQIQRELTEISPFVQQTAKDPHPLRLMVESLQERLYGSNRPMLRLLLIAAVLLFLIACANVANLSLARTLGRGHEWAVRASIGATRWALVREVVTENALLATASGLAGLLVAFGTTRLFAAISPRQISTMGSLGLGGSGVLYAVSLAMLAVLLVSALPALMVVRGDLHPAMGHGGLPGSRRGLAGRARGALVIGQVALALLLLTGCGLMIRTMVRLTTLDLGFSPRGIAIADLILWDVDSTARASEVAEVTRRVRALPGVESVAFGPQPLIAQKWWNPDAGASAISYRGIEPGSSQRPSVLWTKYVDPSYLKTFGVRILRGRGIRASDDASAPLVALVNEAAARVFWHGENPVGRTLDSLLPFPPSLIRGKPVTIVGLLPDLLQRGVMSHAQPELWMPKAQQPWPDNDVSISVRTSGNAAALARSIRQIAWQVDPAIMPERVSTMSAVIAGDEASQRFLLLLIGSFAALALLTAALGLYAVVSFLTARRTDEIGLRMALGADASGIVRMVTWDGLKLALLGIPLGTPLAWVFSRLLETFLFEVDPHDLVTFVAAPALLALAALVAAFVPGRRASHVDPMVALRSE